MIVHKILPQLINPIMVRNTLAAYNGLSVETTDVGVLCKNAKSKWSKFKPVRLNSANNATIPDWWKSTNDNCGLDVPVYPNIVNMFAALRSNTEMWAYLPPRGITFNEHFRLNDFIGYDVEAQPPITPSELNSSYFASFGGMPVSLDVNMPGSTELSLADISGSIDLGNCYFGVAICKQGTSGYKYMTEDITMSNGGGGGFQVPITNELGLYEVVFILCEKYKTSFSAPDIVNRFVPIEFGYKMVTIEYSALTVLVSGTWALSTSNWEVVIENKSNMQIALTGCSLKIRYGDNAENSPLERGEISFTIPVGSDGTIVMLPNSTQTISGVEYNSLPEFNTPSSDPRLGRLYFRNNNSIYNAEGDFEM